MRSEEEIREMLKKIKSTEYKDCGWDPYFPCCAKDVMIITLEWVLGKNYDLLEELDARCF